MARRRTQVRCNPVRLPGVRPVRIGTVVFSAGALALIGWLIAKVARAKEPAPEVIQTPQGPISPVLPSYLRTPEAETSPVYPWGPI